MDSTIALNYNLNKGSGKGVDLFAYVPEAAFQAALKVNPNLTNVYLYSSFGATGSN